MQSIKLFLTNTALRTNSLLTEMLGGFLRWKSEQLRKYNKRDLYVVQRTSPNKCVIGNIIVEKRTMATYIPVTLSIGVGFPLM